VAHDAPVGDRDPGGGDQGGRGAHDHGAHEHKRSESAPALRKERRWVPRLAAYLTAAIGIIDIASALTPEFRRRVHDLTEVIPGPFVRSASALTVVVGILLLLLARGLRKRKRRAWRAVVALLAASIALHVLKGLDVEEAVISLLLLTALIATRDEFQAKGDPTTRWRGLYIGLLLAVTSIVLGMCLIQIRINHVLGPHPLSAQFEHVVYGLVGVHGPLMFTTDRTSDLIARVLLAMGLLTLMSIVYLVLRPSEPRPLMTPDDEQQMRALLQKHGRRDSLGYFALRRDKSVVWSPTGKACIAYRVVSGVMLASGDPLGDPEAWPGAISNYLALAVEHAWTPAVIGCSETGGTAYARAGLSALELGDEAIVEIDDFSLEGRAMRNVRQAVGRVERAGYTCWVRRMGDIPTEELATLRRQADAWRGSETERGFSMALGRYGDPSDGDCVAAMAFHRLAEAPEGAEPVLRAVLHFVPWGSDGLSLDLMRRDRTADNGLNEFLIVHTLRAAEELGVQRISLNFAMFRSALERGERLGAGPVLKAWRGLLVFASRWFQIDSLYRFNAKFRPIWEPRYVCYASTAELPRIAIAMLEAEAFIVWPRPHLRGLAGRIFGRSSAEPV
jgi:lysyl-tRNA synthetase class 2